MTAPRCAARVYGPRVQSWPCTRRGAVERNGRWYCRQHDPDAVRARDEAREAAYRTQKARDEAVQEEARGLARRLGVDGSADYAFGAYRERLVVPFAEARALAARIEALEGALADIGRAPRGTK